jgi:hypothetical protein
MKQQTQPLPDCRHYYAAHSQAVVRFSRLAYPLQLIANDGTGEPTLSDMGASFGIATGWVLTLFIAAPPNGSSVSVRAVDKVSGVVFEQEIAADLPANAESFRQCCS